MNTIIPSDANKPSTIMPSTIMELTKAASPPAPQITETIEAKTNNRAAPITATPAEIPAAVSTRKEEDVPTKQTQTPSDTSPSRQLLNAAVSEMNEFVQSIQRELQFTVDEDSGRTVVKVIDKSTNEVIRQVPPEDLMAMLKEFSKPAQPGLIFKNSA